MNVKKGCQWQPFDSVSGEVNAPPLTSPLTLSKGCHWQTFFTFMRLIFGKMGDEYVTFAAL